MNPTPYKEGEPAPIGCILAKIEGTGQYVWVQAGSLSPRELGPPLSDHLMERARKISDVLGDVMGQSFEKAVENFRRDEDPEREILVWENIGESYSELTHQEDSKERRRMVYHVLLLASTGMDKKQILSSGPRLKSLPDIDDIIESFRRKADNGERQADLL